MAVGGIFLSVLAVNDMVLYGTLGEAEANREKLIANAKTEHAEVLFIPDYPYPQYHWITETTADGNQIEHFRAFYQIPEEMKLQFNEEHEKEIE